MDGTLSADENCTTLDNGSGIKIVNFIDALAARLDEKRIYKGDIAVARYAVESATRRKRVKRLRRRKWQIDALSKDARIVGD